MPSSDGNSHSFIVRVWSEPREIEGAPTEWRGYVEHVASRERRYVRNLDEIGAFIAGYLERMGVRLPRKWQVRRWLSRRKRSSGPGAATGKSPGEED